MGQIRARSEKLADSVRKVAALTAAVADMASTIPGSVAGNILALSEVAEEFASRALADAAAIASECEQQPAQLS